MRLINKIWVIPALAAMVFGCNDDHQSAYGFEEFIQFSSSTRTVDEKIGTPIPVTIQLVGPHRSQATDVTFSVTENNVEEGVDYEIPGGTTVTIPANESSVTFNINVIDNEDFVAEARSIVLTVTDASGVSLQSENAPKKSYTININEDDCPVPTLVGTYSVVNRDASPAACGNPANDGSLTYQATITLVSENGDDSFTYAVTDITGGLYALCYGDAANPGEFDTEGFSITVTDQPDVVYGGDVFNGSGAMDCDGNFTLTWSNGFGDKGTSHYTKL